MRVLLIDDNLTDRKVMARILNGLGHEVLQSRKDSAGLFLTYRNL